MVEMALTLQSQADKRSIRDAPISQFTSESVAEGHPDKLADRISDEILDACLSANAHARVAVETLVTKNRCVLAGEVRGADAIDMEALARRAIRDVGYADRGFGWETVAIENLVHEQSAEIAAAVDRSDGEEGAGDQGIMFGYACRETPALMPAPIVYAHRIVERLAKLRKAGEVRLGPDAKSQVTLLFVSGRPVRADTIVVSQQHAAGFEQELPELVRTVVNDVLPDGFLGPRTRLLVNPSGSFVRGGPAADTGLTGRKIIVDTYGGAAPHGGGAFSGKDPSKVDRSAAYAARWLAKNVVAAGIAERCLVQLAYAIGVTRPVSIRVNTFGTTSADDGSIGSAIERAVDLSPRGLRERLGLARPIYARTAAYGHFGRAPDRDGGFSWEQTDLGEAIIAELK
jgi:S-adenosylmethionine synthetase